MQLCFWHGISKHNSLFLLGRRREPRSGANKRGSSVVALLVGAAGLRLLQRPPRITQEVTPPRPRSRIGQNLGGGG